MTDRPRVVFIGSPPVSVVSLEALHERFEVPLVVTQPDRRKGRGRHRLPTPVRARAEALGLEVLPAPDINAAEALSRIKGAKPDVLVVVSFGQMLGKRLLEVASLGCVNRLHGCLYFSPTVTWGV